jgi:hypothetical protein
VLGIDHGLTFHPAWKVRTVIWDFAGEPVAPQLRDDVCRVLDELDDGPLRARLEEHLSAVEIEAVEYRGRAVLAEGMPYPDDYRSTPWPLV